MLGEKTFSFPEYFQYNTSLYKTIRDSGEDMAIIVAVDNHPARRLVYHLLDEAAEINPKRRLISVSMANEYEEASAWVYLPEWKGTNMDPRVRWPEIMTSDEGDPLAPPCTGEVLQSAPQLALANMLSASAGAWLHRFWTTKEPDFRKNPEDYELVKATFPVWVDFTSGRNKTYTIKELLT